MTEVFNGTTRIALLIDRSGSMASVWDAAIEAVNGFVAGQQQQDDGRTLVSLLLFDATPGEPVIKALCTQERLNKVPALTKQNYLPRGATPLLDAIGETIASLGTVAQPEDRVLIVIQTDGLENNSREYSAETIRGRITERQGAGWTFVFLGADQDAFEVARSINIPRGNVRAYAGDPEGTQAVYYATSGATSSYRATAAGGQSMGNFFGEVDTPEEAHPEEDQHGEDTDLPDPTA